ncbi:MAG: hypothetical protein ACI381_02250 [Candidatus Methanomethylophilaceae archaeon]
MVEIDEYSSVSPVRIDAAVSARMMELMISEVNNQYNTIVSQINSITQKSGIMLAFTSILMIELFDFMDVSLWSWSFTFLGSSVALAVLSMIVYTKIRIGIDFNSMTDMYLDQDYLRLEDAVYNKKTDALAESIHTLDRLFIIFLFQVLFFSVGLFLFILIEVM